MGLDSGSSTSGDLNWSVSSTTFDAVNDTQILPVSSKLRPSSNGRTLRPYEQVGSGDTKYASYVAEFAIPLPSFLGFLSKKMVPLHNGFTILITLGSVENAFFQAGGSPQVPYMGVTTSNAWTITTAQVAGGKVLYAIDTTSDAGGEFAPPVGSFITVTGLTPTDYNVTKALVVKVSGNVVYINQPWTSTDSSAPTADATVSADSVLTSVPSSVSYAERPKIIAESSSIQYDLTVSDVFMDCQILELGPVAESMILSSTGGQPLVVHTKSFRSYVGNVLSTAQEFILNLNLNVASMTNILWLMRSKDQLQKINYQSIGHRTRNMLQRWFFQYGSTTLPQNNGIQTMGTNYPSGANTLLKKYMVADEKYTEGYLELMKARPIDPQNSRIARDNFASEYKWGSKLISDAKMTSGGEQVASLGSLLNAASFGFQSLRSTLPVGKFAGGLNLELAPNKSGVFHPLFTEYMDNCRIDAYAEYDAFINVSPGIATTVSF
jgi:hypothetical protein